MKTNFLSHSLFSLFVFFLPFEDTILSVLGGVATSSPAVIFLLLGAVYTLITNKIILRKIYILFYLFMLLVSFIYLFYWVYVFPQLDMVFLFDRGMRFMLIIHLYFLAIWYTYKQDSSFLYFCAKLVCFVIFLSLFINLLFPDLLQNDWVHYNALASSRFTGVAFESSSFGFQIVCSCILFAIIFRLNFILFLLLVLTAAVLSSSKGALACLVIALWISFLFLKNVKFPLKIISLAALIVIGYFCFKFYLYIAFSNDIENFTSVATRSTVFLLGIKSLLFYPFGVGVFGYLPNFYENGPGVMLFLREYSPIFLNFGEVLNYFQVGSVKSVGAKSTVVDLVLFAGWPFLFIFSLWLKKLIDFYNCNYNYLYLVLIFFVLLANIFFISSFSLYLTPFIIGFLIKVKSQFISEGACNA